MLVKILWQASLWFTSYGGFRDVAFVILRKIGFNLVIYHFFVMGKNTGQVKAWLLKWYRSGLLALMSNASVTRLRWWCRKTLNKFRKSFWQTMKFHEFLRVVWKLRSATTLESKIFSGQQPANLAPSGQKYNSQLIRLWRLYFWMRMEFW